MTSYASGAATKTESTELSVLKSQKVCSGSPAVEQDQGMSWCFILRTAWFCERLL